MSLRKFVWKSNCIEYTIEEPTEQGEEVTTKSCPEAPMQGCEDARHALLDIVASAMEVPLHWLGVVRKSDGHIEPGTETVKPYGIVFSETKAGTRSAQVLYTKRFRSGKVEKYKTSLLQYDEPAEGETEKCAFTARECATLNAMHSAAIMYIGGARQPCTLKFVAHGSIPADENQENLEFVEDPATAK